MKINQKSSMQNTEERALQNRVCGQPDKAWLEDSPVHQCVLIPTRPTQNVKAVDRQENGNDRVGQWQAKNQIMNKAPSYNKR